MSHNYLGLIINGFDVDDDLRYLSAARRFGDELSEAFLGIPNSVECIDLSKNYFDELRKPEGVFGGMPSSVSSVIFRENYLGRTPYINEALTALSSLPETVKYLDLKSNSLLSNLADTDQQLTDKELELFFYSIIRKGRKIDVDICVLDRLMVLGINLETPAESNKPWCRIS